MLRDPYFLIPVAIILGLGLLIDIASILPEYSRQPQRIAAHIRDAEPGTVKVTYKSEHQDLPSEARAQRHGGPMAYVWAPGMREKHVLICYISLSPYQTYPDRLQAVPAKIGPMKGMSQALNGRVTDDVRSVCEPYLPKIVDGRMEAKWR